MTFYYDIKNKESIISYAKNLKGKNLREVCGSKIEKHGYKGKGNFGQILEKFYFFIIIYRNFSSF